MGLESVGKRHGFLMVNTRILQQRLGWRAEDGDTPPPGATAAHRPVLQGRVEPVQRGVAARSNRRGAAEDLWAQLPVIEPVLAGLAGRGRVPAFDRASETGAAMDRLRTQLTRVLAEKGWRRIGITSATRGAGRSFVATALAVSLARLETLRILLVDADFEAPGLADLLGIEAPGAMDAVLGGTAPPESALLRVGTSLALAFSNAPVPQATERLLAPDAILSMRALIDCVAPDVVIHDLPPLIDDTLTQALLPQLDAVLLVADGTRTTARDILACERLLEGQVPMLGVILNKSEDKTPRDAPRRRV